MADHGKLEGNRGSSGYAEARQLFADLEELGIGYQDVVTVLEEEGVAKFAASWQEMLDTLSTELAAASQA
jgi:transaldolase